MMDCQACGACCRQPWRIPVQPDDATPRHLTIPVVAGKTYGATSEDEAAGLALMRKEGGQCVALACEGDRWACSIYEDRPAACRQFEAGSPRCLCLANAIAPMPTASADYRAGDQHGRRVRKE